mmetsp:Transcript_68485/g.172580  ORF Transcript_68485/g.172580 Transcript_68485/m.172580 type:complete len:209 (-) Transcript_68485:464-1090(-)
MRRMHATQVPKRVKLVPVSCESMDKLQSKQKITTLGGPSIVLWGNPPPARSDTIAPAPLAPLAAAAGAAEADVGARAETTSTLPAPVLAGGSTGRPRSRASVVILAGWKSGMRAAVSSTSRTDIHRRRWQISTRCSLAAGSRNNSGLRPKSSSQSSLTRTPQLYNAADALMRPATSRSPQRMTASTASSEVPPLPSGSGSPYLAERAA